MAVWWIGEALPLAATSLLPMILFPLFGVMNSKDVAAQYFNATIFLFLGGFIVALAMERWNLHRRIALRILLLFGARPGRILLGFMVATWALSMWISNTAAAMMMVTIVLAIVVKMEEESGREKVGRFAVALLIGVAYGASIGGIATLVGTPPNLSFARLLVICFPEAPDISFASWFVFAAPVSLALLLAAWGLLWLFFAPRRGEIAVDPEVLRRQHRELGKMSLAERLVFADFVILVVLWLFREEIDVGAFVVPGWGRFLPTPAFLSDGTVAIGMALLLFLLPSGARRGERLMDWATAERLPWGIVLLFGGGFALARGFVDSGLSQWIGESLKGASDLGPVALLGVVCMVITFLTELTSNTATAEMSLPVLAGLCQTISLNPLYLMVPAALSCSCAFMLPVATPPNAIIFGTGRLRIIDLARTGFLLNLLGAVIIVAAMHFLGPLVFSIDLGQMPAWAHGK
ncbi:MAG: SLC13/DASS family transporter [Planctomycetes bacterium]|nr:SLC13/DASS family transporter [Planctomycetota bacterium]